MARRVATAPVELDESAELEELEELEEISAEEETPAPAPKRRAPVKKAAPRTRRPAGVVVEETVAKARTRTRKAAPEPEAPVKATRRTRKPAESVAEAPTPRKKAASTPKATPVAKKAAQPVKLTSAGTPMDIEWLRDHINSKFDTDLTTAQMSVALRRVGVQAGPGNRHTFRGPGAVEVKAIAEYFKQRIDPETGLLRRGRPSAESPLLNVQIIDGKVVVEGPMPPRSQVGKPVLSPRTIARREAAEKETVRVAKSATQRKAATTRRTKAAPAPEFIEPAPVKRRAAKTTPAKKVAPIRRKRYAS